MLLLHIAKILLDIHWRMPGKHYMHSWLGWRFASLRGFQSYRGASDNMPITIKDALRARYGDRFHGLAATLAEIVVSSLLADGAISRQAANQTDLWLGIKLALHNSLDAEALIASLMAGEDLLPAAKLEGPHREQWQASIRSILAGAGEG